MCPRGFFLKKKKNCFFFSCARALPLLFAAGFVGPNPVWPGGGGLGIDLTTFPNGKEAAEELWEKINFSLDKVVVSLFGYSGNDLTDSYSAGEEVPLKLNIPFCGLT